MMPRIGVGEPISLRIEYGDPDRRKSVDSGCLVESLVDPFEDRSGVVGPLQR